MNKPKPTRPRPNIFAGTSIDRAAEHRNDPEWLAEAAASREARFIPLWREQQLVTEAMEPRATLLSHDDLRGVETSGAEQSFLGLYGGRACFALDLGDDQQRAAWLRARGVLQGIRQIATLLPEEDSALLAYARAMVLWQRAHRFCPRCGAPSISDAGGHLRRCSDPVCARPQFPRLDPAVIVLVQRADACLLGRQRGWTERVYSTIAGFVEPGESLEDSVAREVLEETDIRVGNVHYHSSQPWPFPSSIMLGFTAEAASETIVCRDGELEDARWFTRAAIDAHLLDTGRGLPSEFSIAFRLLADWYDAATPGALAARVRARANTQPGS